jgi:hypothetical protein
MCSTLSDVHDAVHSDSETTAANKETCIYGGPQLFSIEYPFRNSIISTQFYTLTAKTKQYTKRFNSGEQKFQMSIPRLEDSSCSPLANQRAMGICGCI